MSVHVAVSQTLKDKKDKKARKLKGDAAESEVTFVRTNTTLSVVTQDSDSDSDGEDGTGRRKKGGKSKNYDSDGSKRRKGKAGKDGAGGGKKKGKKGKEGRGSDSDGSGGGKKKGKDKKKKKGKGEGEEDEDEDEGSESRKGTGENDAMEEGAEDGDSDYSYRSEVSEGGTRYVVKMKRVRDKDGNVVGYGDPQPVADDFRGASVIGREGSVSGTSEAGYYESFRPGDLGLPEDEKGAAAREPAWKKERERRRQSKLEAEAMAAARDGYDPGGADGQTVPEAMERVPSTFSDATTASDAVDLSAMTEEERAAYLASRELRRKKREERRQEKYGDRYSEIMKKKQEKKDKDRQALEERRKEEEERRKEEEERLQREKQEAEKEEAKKRRMSNSLKTTSSVLQKKEKPKSMVTYEKAQPRGLSGRIEKTDHRDIGPSHNDWTKNERRMSREDSNVSYSNKFSSFQRMKTTDDGGKGLPKRRMPDRGELIDREKQRQIAEEAKKHLENLENKDEYAHDDLLEIDEAGKIRLKAGKKIDLSKLSDSMLRKLGIDPRLSKKAKAKLLKSLLGDDVIILDGGRPVGFRSLSQYDLDEVTDDMLADDPELDIDTLSGQRRVNVLMRRGGLTLKEHMIRVMEQSRLMDDQAYRNDLDEKDGSVDFMTHYRLVNPSNLEGYARAFVVEDHDLDTVINLAESKTALEGIPSMNQMTPKQMDYVLRVLNITDATQITFRMFAVVTALCERVSSMDAISKHLLEICNLADIERKLDLYMNMFYHNRRGDRDGNYIKADSLKIELIAGGLNWKQQQYIMEKMEVNMFGEISFLDYMCYIPLFLSLHDNIVDNPLDMSDQKYTQPPRTRPPSSQRDMNPLGFPLNKKSSLLMRKQARDLMEGRLNAAGFRPETRDRLQRFARLPPIKPFRRPSMTSSHTSELSSERTKTDFFLGQ